MHLIPPDIMLALSRHGERALLLHAGLAAILPCFWVYQHIGEHLKQHGSSHPDYQRWIDMYGGVDFEATVSKARVLMDQTAEALTAAQRAACVQHFCMCTRLEYMFFDAPYKGETWPEATL